MRRQASSGDDEQDDELFAWARQDMVRPTDPPVSHQAKDRVDLEGDRQLAWKLFNQMMREADYPPTRTTFQKWFLPSLGYGFIRSKSITRRFSDLVVRPGNPEGRWLLKWTGQKFEGAEVMTLTQWGKMVLANPKLMVGLWGQRNKKKKKPRKPKR